MTPSSCLRLFVVLTLAASAAARAQEPAASAPLRVGIVGLDAHAVPWTKIITDPHSPAPIHDMKVVAAVPAFSPDIPFSADNIEQNIMAMRDMGVELVATVEELLPKVDAVMVLPHGPGTGEGRADAGNLCLHGSGGREPAARWRAGVAG